MKVGPDACHEFGELLGHEFREFHEIVRSLYGRNCSGLFREIREIRGKDLDPSSSLQPQKIYLRSKRTWRMGATDVTPPKLAPFTIVAIVR